MRVGLCDRLLLERQVCGRVCGGWPRGTGVGTCSPFNAQNKRISARLSGCRGAYPENKDLGLVVVTLESWWRDAFYSCCSGGAGAH